MRIVPWLALYDGSTVALAYSFVLEELQSLLSPDRLRVRAMFGSHALYVDEKIVFIVRRKGDRDDGVWVALSDPAHGTSLSKDFPSLRTIEMFGRKAFASWLNLPDGEDGFEEYALALCGLVRKRDPRIGKVPKGRKKRKRA